MAKDSASLEPGTKRNPKSKGHLGRGRPRLIGERLDTLLDAAADVFIEGGFEGASTSEIARRAGASKLSLYSRFPTKEDLFVAVLERRTDRIFSGITSAIQNPASLDEALSAFGANLLESALSDSHISLLRVVSMETVRFPRLGQRFFELGPKRGIAALAAYLESQVAAGRLRKGDPRVMAQQYLGMIVGPALLFTLMGVEPGLRTGTQRSTHIRLALEAFKRAYERI